MHAEMLNPWTTVSPTVITGPKYEWLASNWKALWCDYHLLGYPV